MRKTPRRGREEEPVRSSGGGLEIISPGSREKPVTEKLFSENKAGDENETAFTAIEELVSK